MKKLLIIAVAFIAGACTDLDLEPSGSITKEQFFQTEDDGIAAINGVYQSLTYTAQEQALYGRNLYFLTDMGTDYAAAGASASNFHVQSVSKLAIVPANDRVALVWRQIYNGINRANVAIDNIPDISGDEALKNRLINEARFIRALLFYNAVRLWGDVPLPLHEAQKYDVAELKIGRTAKETVYQQIITDLVAAQELPDAYTGDDIGRPTSGSAYALLADVYLTRKEYDRAAETAQFIIDNASRWGYRLVDKFSDLFTNPATKNGPEHIFSVQFENGQSGVTGSTGQTLASTSYYGPVGIEPPDVPASDEAGYLRFDPADTRRTVSYLKQYPNPIGLNEDGTPAYYPPYPRALFIKWVSSITKFTGRGADPINFPVIRYSEILLILAEAIGEQGAPTAAAYEAVNQVRRRAFGKLPVTAASPEVDLSGLTQQQFIQAVRDERFFEFVQEGKRWFDLVRWGTLVEAIKDVEYNGSKLKEAVSDRSYLYPIPQEQRELNPDGLPQNPGYAD
ncbi:MAG: RagB/SusD family nutrient uptake outer membrane protein [Bacteroidales bacterium]|jgi:hypothetical protein|nr:RagB/SusD family nutrient uptake outer membrane protein [Bacteroidales bacterium]